jgi:hypothetical protein
MRRNFLGGLSHQACPRRSASAFFERFSQRFPDILDMEGIENANSTDVERLIDVVAVKDCAINKLII